MLSNIDILTLEEWEELNPNYEEDLNNFLKLPIKHSAKYTHQPAGYKQLDPLHCIPDEAFIKKYLEILAELRYKPKVRDWGNLMKLQKEMEGSEYLLSTDPFRRLLSKLEDAMGLLPPVSSLTQGKRTRVVKGVRKPELNNIILANLSDKRRVLRGQRITNRATSKRAEDKLTVDKRDYRRQKDINQHELTAEEIQKELVIPEVPRQTRKHIVEFFPKQQKLLAAEETYVFFGG